MNDVPPKLHDGSRESDAPVRSASFTQKHLIIGIVAGFVAGALAASLFWIPVGGLLLKRSGMKPDFVRVQSSESPVASDKATMAEIDAAAQLSFEQNRLSLLNQIASRPSLSPEAQVHLAKTVFRHLTFENNKMEALSKLIENPSFSLGAKESILNNIRNLSFENNKQAILQAMSRRENQK
jgi:hypothetical protein